MLSPIILRLQSHGSVSGTVSGTFFAVSKKNKKKTACFQSSSFSLLPADATLKQFCVLV